MSTVVVEATPPELERSGVDELQERVAETCGLLNVVHGELVALVAEALEQDLWVQWGIHSPEQWLEWRAGLSPSRAAEVVAVARRMTDLPSLAEAVTHGSLSLDQAAVVARRTPVGFDDDAVAIARNATVAQLRQILRSNHFPDPQAKPAEPDSDPTPETPEPQPQPQPEPERGPRASFGTTDHGTWRLHAELPPDEGAIVEQALNAAAAALEDQREEGDPPVTWADALVHLARTALGTQAEAQPDRDLFRVLVHLEVDPTQPSGPGIAGLHLGAPLPAALRRMLLCDGSVVPVWERYGTPVSVGRSQRTVPDRLRRLVENRDLGCRVSGCRRKRRLHIHHIIHWEDDGLTDEDNLIALCAKHHRQHHLGLLGITGTAHDLVITDARGRVLEPTGIPTPPSGPRPASALYEHPPGEPLELKWIDLAPNRN